MRASPHACGDIPARVTERLNIYEILGMPCWILMPLAVEGVMPPEDI